MANALASADKQQFDALTSAIERHAPIHKWLQDQHRGLLSMRDIVNWTPLNKAAAFGNAGATALLLEAGVQVDPQTNSGSTPLYLASVRGHI